MISDACIAVELPEPLDGPYDLEHWGFLDAGEQGLVLVLELGMGYDFYSLECPLAGAPAWELWHTDSAVMHVDRECLARDVRFTCNRLELPPPVDPFTGGDSTEGQPPVRQGVLEADGAAGTFLVTLEGEGLAWTLDRNGFRKE